MILTENHTMIDPRDIGALVELARIAEVAGFDAAMISEQVILGPNSGELGLPDNPREYAAIGNQDPMTPWPSSIVLMSAVAAATTRLRVVAGAIIPPLRHPLLLAKDLATLDLLARGRLVVQPTVSWQRAEYDAFGVPFNRRGRILDEHLDAMHRLWAPSPASFNGEFFTFDRVYSEPKPFRPGGPQLWFGGETMHEALVRRIVRYGHGFHPFGTPTDEDLAVLSAGMEADGRSLSELELVGGTRATFDGPDSVADVDASMGDFEQQMSRGYTTFCMKPSQYTDRLDEVPDICRRMVDHVNRQAFS